MLSKNQINKIKAFAMENAHIAAVYLFGSQATGKSKKGSDVDLAILFYGKLGGMKRIDLETDLCNLIKEDVDLVDMQKASPLLRHQVYKYGREIFSKEENYPAVFRAKSIQEYMDTLYLHEKRMEIMYGR